MNTYTVVLRGNPVNSTETCTATYDDVVASNSLHAEEEAAALASYDGYENVSIVSVNQNPTSTRSYTPYDRHTYQTNVSSTQNYTYQDEPSYTPYGGVSVAESEPTEDGSNYQPYASVNTATSASSAPESWHSTMSNGYCPYRSFRNALPFGYKPTT